MSASLPMTRNERIATLLLVVGTTAAATYTVLIAGSFGQAAFRLGYDVMAVGALVPWLAFVAIRKSRLPSSNLMPAIGACLGAFAVATVTSRIPRLSLEMVAYNVLLAGVYLLAVALMRRPRIRTHFGRLALLMCLIVCAFYLVQVFQAWLIWWDLVGRPAIPPLRPAYVGFNLGSPNPLAALVLLLAAFGLATVGFRGRTGGVAAGTLVLLVGIVVLLTASRGAWLGAAVGLLVTMTAAVLTLPDAQHRVFAFVRSQRGAAAAALVALVAVAGTAVAVIGGRLTLADNARQVFAQVSLRMFESSPLTGTGPGTWPVLRASYTAADEIDAYVPHAHSIYWQLLAEFGLLGVVVGVVVAGSLGLLIIRALRSGDKDRRRMALAALFGVVLLAVHQTVDMFMNIPALLLAIGLPIAWLDATQASTAPRPASASPGPSVMRQRGRPLAAAAAVGVIGAALLGMESTSIAYLPAVSAANAGNWDEAQTLAQRAVDTDPKVAAYQFTLGVSAANAGDLTVAERALFLGAKADDYTYAWLDLAAVRWRVGDAAGARVALSSAERLGLRRPTVALPAGWLRQQLGDQPAAIDDYTAALLNAPTLAADPFWKSDPELEAAWPRVWANAQALAPPRTLLVLDLVAGRMDLAVPVAAVLGEHDAALYGAIVDAWQGDPSAWESLQALASMRPADGDTLGWCQLIAEHRGERDAIYRFVRWIDINGSPIGTRPQLAHVTFDPTQPMSPSVIDNYELLYRRPVPDAQIVGMLPQVAWRDPD